MAYGDWENMFGVDYSQFSLSLSLSYCWYAFVSQFDNKIAATKNKSLVFVAKHLAVFLFCPEAMCIASESSQSMLDALK